MSVQIFENLVKIFLTIRLKISEKTELRYIINKQTKLHIRKTERIDDFRILEKI